MAICVINGSTVVTDAEVQAAVAAINKQVNGEFYNAWRLRANVIALGKGYGTPAGAWLVHILDETTQQGALGWHEEDGSTIVGYVFAKTDKEAGLSWTVTLSHEVLEAIVDPLCQLTVLQQTGSTPAGRLLTYEVCDAVESDALSYEIDGIKVSDFCYPAYYDATRAPGSAKFDHMGHITAPFQLAPGGYAAYLNVSWTGDWQQQDADGHPKPADPDDARGGRARARTA